MYRLDRNLAPIRASALLVRAACSNYFLAFAGGGNGPPLSLLHPNTPHPTPTTQTISSPHHQPFAKFYGGIAITFTPLSNYFHHGDGAARQGIARCRRLPVVLLPMAGPETYGVDI